MSLSNFMDAHEFPVKTAKKLRGFINDQMQVKTQPGKQITVSIYGEKGCGKTTCSMSFAQMPVFDSVSSKFSSILQSVVAYKGTIEQLLIHEINEPNMFLLTDSVFLIANALNPLSTLYFNNIVDKFFPFQQIFVILNKCDVCKVDQFQESLVRSQELVQQLQKRGLVTQFFPAKLSANASVGIFDVIVSQIVKAKAYSQLKQETENAYKTFVAQQRANQNLFAERLIGSMGKRDLKVGSETAKALIPESPLLQAKITKAPTVKANLTPVVEATTMIKDQLNDVVKSPLIDKTKHDKDEQQSEALTENADNIQLVSQQSSDQHNNKIVGSGSPEIVGLNNPNITISDQQRLIDTTENQEAQEIDNVELLDAQPPEQLQADQPHDSMKNGQ